VITVLIVRPAQSALFETAGDDASDGMNRSSELLDASLWTALRKV